ncbi:MAG: hypothetical protein ABL967_04895 [Bryobacteraceae bacterium]
MRLFLLTLMIAVALPLVGASGYRAQCRNACDRDYDLCLKRSVSKAARKTCAVFHKTCKRNCPAI